MMALDALLARLEGRVVTPVTDGAISNVTPKPAMILVHTPLTCSPVTCVTSVTSVTAKNDDTVGESISEPIPDPATEARRQRVLTMLADNPALRLAVVCDGAGDPVPVAVAIRDKGSVEILIPAARFDPFALLELVERHTVH